MYILGWLVDESAFSFLDGGVGALYILLTFLEKCMDFWNDFLISNYRSITKIKRIMSKVLKSFLAIVVSCFGIGLSMSLPGFLNLILVGIFVMLDLIGIFFVLKYSRSDLWGVFYTFFPSLALIEIIQWDGLIVGFYAKMVLVSLEYSFISVMVGLLILSVILSLRKTKISVKNWRWVFLTLFF